MDLSGSDSVVTESPMIKETPEAPEKLDNGGTPEVEDQDITEKPAGPDQVLDEASFFL